MPFADAGPDRELLNWDGGPVTLDGSASRDRPGGDNASLTYAELYARRCRRVGD